MKLKQKELLKLSRIPTSDLYSKIQKLEEESLISEISLKDLALKSLQEKLESKFGSSVLKIIKKKILSSILSVLLKSKNNIKMV